jgi:hypothetical protein
MYPTKEEIEAVFPGKDRKLQTYLLVKYNLLPMYLLLDVSPRQYTSPRITNA